MQAIHLGTLPELEDLCKRKEIVHIAFTGSVAGGLAVQKAAVNSENPFKSIPPLIPPNIIISPSEFRILFLSLRTSSKLHSY